MVSDTKERICWIDVIKAICIFSVMYNHQPFAENWIRIDYFFLVGFFFCSGLTFNMNKGLKYRLVRIIDSLIIPYFLLTSLVFFLYANNLKGLFNGNFQVVFDYWRDVVEGRFAWFVPCLISVEIIYAISVKYKIQRYVVVGGAVLFVSGCLNGLSLPWHVDTALYSIIFFHMGYIMKDLLDPNFKTTLKEKGLLIPFVLVYLYASYILMKAYPFSTSVNDFYNESLILIMNIVGIVLLVSVSKSITSNKYLNYLGKNTLSLFFIHVPFVYYIYQILNRFFDLNSPYIDNSITGIIYVFAVSIIMYPIIHLLCKFNILVGKGHIIEHFVYRK